MKYISHDASQPHEYFRNDRSNGNEENEINIALRGRDIAKSSPAS